MATATKKATQAKHATSVRLSPRAIKRLVLLAQKWELATRSAALEQAIKRAAEAEGIDVK